MTLDTKLVVILHADIVDSTNLVHRNERLAHERIRTTFLALSERISEFNGIAHEVRGDALVAEFNRASDAVSAALSFQSANAEANAQRDDEIRPAVRVGISIGEVVVDAGTLTGAAVVLAQRLEQLAAPGTVCIQHAVYESLPRRLPFEYHGLGEQRLKGFDEPVRAYRVAERGEPSVRSPLAQEQQIRFCTAPDGVGIAYAFTGQGTPIVKAANWLSHLEYDWDNPVWRDLYEELANEHTLLRYDVRGSGLSDWDAGDISFDAFVSDLECVVDAAGLSRFALFGVSQGCAVSVAYAARNPDRVSHLILYGGFPKGERHLAVSDAEEARIHAMNTLVREGWGQDNPAFRQMFTSMFIPGANPAQMHWFNELQRVSATPENASKILDAIAELNVMPMLSDISTPTLVMHVRDDSVIDMRRGQEFAKHIPNARFVPLPGKNHLILKGEPAWSRFVAEIREFLSPD